MPVALGAVQGVGVTELMEAHRQHCGNPPTHLQQVLLTYPGLPGTGGDACVTEMCVHA